MFMYVTHIYMVCLLRSSRAQARVYKHTHYNTWNAHASVWVCVEGSYIVLSNKNTKFILAKSQYFEIDQKILNMLFQSALCTQFFGFLCTVLSCAKCLCMRQPTEWWVCVQCAYTHFSLCSIYALCNWYLPGQSTMPTQISAGETNAE